MNKVITINLNGNAYQLEEIGYEALRTYLDNAARQLAANPDKDEIITDIEQAIGEKCRALTGPYRTVVLARDIERIIAEMGPVIDGSATSSERETASAPKGGRFRPARSPGPSAQTSWNRRLLRRSSAAGPSRVTSDPVRYLSLSNDFSDGVRFPEKPPRGCLRTA